MSYYRPRLKLAYIRYMASPQWQVKRLAVRQIYEQSHWEIKCLKCLTHYGLQLHHNYYVAYLDYANLSDFDYLCERCHKEWHKIQKSLMTLQNHLLWEYYAFICKDKRPEEIRAIRYLLEQKVDKDRLEIEPFFESPATQEYIKFQNSWRYWLAFWLFFFSVFFLFIYGLGIITFIIAYKMSTKHKEPKNFDLYKEKWKSLNLKEWALGYLDRLAVEADKLKEAVKPAQEFPSTELTCSGQLQRELERTGQASPLSLLFQDLAKSNNGLENK